MSKGSVAMIFESLMQGSVDANERAILARWQEKNMLKEILKHREGAKPFVFFEGPPTANGRPGIHHVISRTLKDSICRYKTMQGYRVARKAGWDTHGLPVEIEVEKQLGLKDKTQIEAYGIEKFNQKCKESVFSYEDLWRQMTERMGYEIDLDDPYITLDNDYIESVWWILDQFHKQGYIYEGHKILPYCPRCGTGLASHEVAQGYKEIKSNTVIAKFKEKDAPHFFLVWTTTPWTLASNVSLTVNPQETYVLVRAEESGETYYVEKNLASKIIKGPYEILETYQGKDLEYKKYEPLMPFVEGDKEAFFVTCADYVTTEDGTGIVHTAPAFGEDDYQTGKRYDLPVLQPVNEEGFYTQTPWAGKFVLDPETDIEIIKWLHSQDKLYSREKMAHNYPHCWRCSTPLLYYAKPSWYIEMTKLKEKLIENNNRVEWYPPYVGEKRFGNWLENLNDWAISRSRYWGTPLNLWRCECGNIESVGSRAELKERAIEPIDENVELHRPYVDDIHLKCSCGKSMTRVTDVIDCWFDSGSMPFAQHHYPFENKENFDALFPADFICEGIDQTRGWYYSLLAISTFVKGVSPYKRVLVNDLILDKDGQKMSKSKGNTVDPFELFQKYGADALRWYLVYVSPAWTPTKFDEEGLKEVQSKFFGTFKNVYNFFTLYANTDGINPKDFDIPWNERPELDRWLLSKYERLLNNVTHYFEHYDLTKVAREVQEFVNEDLSNWYIRRSRRRFWDTTLTEDKKSVYLTTYEVLVGVSQMIAPIAPYLAEEIYQKLTGGFSVHVSLYPVHRPELLAEKLEAKMDLVRDLVKLGRASRENVKIKVRQPIQSVIIDGKYKETIDDLIPLIQEELNVKDVVFKDHLNEYMNFGLKPNFKAAGPHLGSKIKAFGKALSALDANVYAPKFEAKEKVEMTLEGEIVSIEPDWVQISIDAKEGFNVTMEDNKFVILDTVLSPLLLKEGLAREAVSKIQQLRKSRGFEILDAIYIAIDGDEAVKEALSQFEDYIKGETIGASLSFEAVEGPVYDLNGHETKISVQKVKA